MTINATTNTATKEIDKICTKCGRKGHWEQEHNIVEEIMKDKHE